MSQLPAKKTGIRNILIVLLAALLLVTAVSFIKYTDGEINYRCSDATWHTMLTIRAYDQTPVETHKFLPIVSLGGSDDKGIPWGSTIADAQGNYYYTSFSAAGYVLPYLFIKAFGLPVSEGSLYLFNSILFFMSAALWGLLLLQAYKKSKHSLFIALIGIAVYVLSPELLHGMGISYWHQSIMQVTLLVQVLAYMRMREKRSIAAGVIFYLFALINPYIEWTGYVANAGFALAELIVHWKESKGKAFLRAVILGVITVAALGLFSLHYLSVVEPNEFLHALKARFMSRNAFAGPTALSIFKGYVFSFWWLWLLAAILFVWSIIKSRGFGIRNKLLLFILLFPVLENFLMVQHAHQYTYDRMKLIFGLSLVICELSLRLLEHASRKRLTCAAVACLVAASGALNLVHYIGNTSYIWPVDHRENNRVLAEYIEENYGDNVLGSDFYVRGYVNLLFERGVYELAAEESLLQAAQSKSRDYAVLLKSNRTLWNLDEFEEAVVYDVKSGDARLLRVENGAVSESDYTPPAAE